MVARKLLSLGYDVVTEDALVLTASPAVRRLVALLRYEYRPDDAVNRLAMATLFPGVAFPESLSGEPSGGDTSLYARCEAYLLRYVTPSESDALFVATFLDEVLAFMQKYGSDLPAFLRWWEETGVKRFVAAPDTRNAVRVMTIHKAKGLDFPVVVLPFLNESFQKTGGQLPFIWSKPVQEPFARVGLIPLQLVPHVRAKERWQRCPLSPGEVWAQTNGVR